MDDMLDISSPALVRNIGFVLVCVAYRSANAVAGTNGLFVANTPTLGSTSVGARVGRAGGRRLDADSYFDTTDPAYSANTSRLDSGLFNYTGGTCALRSLGSQVASFAWASPGNTSDTDSNGISIGAQQGSPSPVYFLTGRIYSLIVRCAVTSTAQIRQTENYLNQESKIY